ncbi:hypothetical protein A9Q96_09520 [Rhodobacterales bacterium 52_120_T64]|nr:hypothetical protein A9Q96_09520 [Rhodobacterales bacterium 52_120_T64]
MKFGEAKSRFFNFCTALLVAITISHQATGQSNWVPLGTTGWTSSSSFAKTKPASTPPTLSQWSGPVGNSELAKLRSLISLAESWQDQYDAHHLSAKIPPSGKPSTMTIADIQLWIAATPGQHHAIGRYQIVPETLQYLVDKSGISESARYSPALQDMFADMLIYNAGYKEYMAGDISLGKFMDNLAGVWAGLPLQSGKSAYHNYAGNRATITRQLYESEMKRIFNS